MEETPHEDCLLLVPQISCLQQVMDERSPNDVGDYVEHTKRNSTFFKKYRGNIILKAWCSSH